MCRDGQEAKGLRDAGLLRGGSFGAMLAEWAAGEGGLSPQSAQAMATEAERLLRSADQAAWQRSSFRHKAALYVLLSGDRRIAEHLLRVTSIALSVNSCRQCISTVILVVVLF